MRSLANQAASSLQVQAFVRGLVLRYPSLASMDSWFRNHFIHRGEIEEIIRSPGFMLRDLETFGYFEGDCDDAATLYAALLKALGFPVRFVAIRFDSTPDFKHVFIETYHMKIVDAEVRSLWIRLDPTVELETIHHEVERMVMDV